MSTVYGLRPLSPCRIPAQAAMTANSCDRTPKEVLAGALIDQRRSDEPVYAFSGAAVQGKKENAFVGVTSYWPGVVFSIDPMSVSCVNAWISSQQQVSLGTLPGLLARGPPHDCTISGWSIGSWFAYASASVLETFGAAARAFMMLDDRRNHPDPVTRIPEVCQRGRVATFDDSSDGYFMFVTRQFALGWTQTYIRAVMF